MSLIKPRRLILVTAFLPFLASAQEAPKNDYHQHLLSPAVAKLIGNSKPFAARDLIAAMDAAGIRRSLVLSLAYQFGNPHRAPVADEYAMVQAENDWTASNSLVHKASLRILLR